MTGTNPPENGAQTTLVAQFREAVRTRLLQLGELPDDISDEEANRIIERMVDQITVDGARCFDSPRSTAADGLRSVLVQLDELRTATLDAAKDPELREPQSHAFQVALEAVTTKASLLGLFPVMNSYEGRPAPDAS